MSTVADHLGETYLVRNDDSELTYSEVHFLPFWELLSQFQAMQDSEVENAEYQGKLYNEDAMKAVEKGLAVIMRQKHK